MLNEIVQQSFADAKSERRKQSLEVGGTSQKAYNILTNKFQKEKANYLRTNNVKWSLKNRLHQKH